MNKRQHKKLLNKLIRQAIKSDIENSAPWESAKLATAGTIGAIYFLFGLHPNNIKAVLRGLKMMLKSGDRAKLISREIRENAYRIEGIQHEKIQLD